MPCSHISVSKICIILLFIKTHHDSRFYLHNGIIQIGSVKLLIIEIIEYYSNFLIPLIFTLFLVLFIANNLSSVRDIFTFYTIYHSLFILPHFIFIFVFFKHLPLSKHFSKCIFFHIHVIWKIALSLIKE